MHARCKDGRFECDATRSQVISDKTRQEVALQHCLGMNVQQEVLTSAVEGVWHECVHFRGYRAAASNLLAAG